MLKRKSLLLILTVILISIIHISFIPTNSGINSINQEKINPPNVSASLEGIENVIITEIIRRANISGYGYVTFEDQLSVKNLNNNPITSIFIGIPLNHSEHMVFFETTGINKNTLLVERTSMIMNNYEMIAIYFDSPLLPQQTKSIKILHQYKDLVSYHSSGDDQNFKLNTFVYPILPYKSEGNIISNFFVPNGASSLIGDWGFENPDFFFVRFELEFIEHEIGGVFLAPFLENLNERKEVTISFTHNIFTKVEINGINREIFISPWGIIRVKEDITIQNLGYVAFNSFAIRVPLHAEGIYVSDDLGEILGVQISNPPNVEYKDLIINLLANRISMLRNSKFRFSLEYYLPYENYFSVNWFQESIQIDLLITTYDFLGSQQVVNVIIDGCYSIDSITDPPNAIKKSHGTFVLVYESDFVSPLEKKLIQITFTIDLFDLLLRPIFFIFIIAIIASAYVLIIKIRKKEYDTSVVAKEFIPINEIREFCSLHEEKNALILEIRQAEEYVKRRKMTKKKYKNILSKNTSKLDEIQQEIIPFKKEIVGTSETFENIIKKLDVLEAERTSVKDSLSLLESRYKRGKVPSRAVYQKLSDDFKKRRKKIDRTIDKLIQQLRSYIL